METSESYRDEQEKRQREQQEQRQKAEVELLDSLTNMREFIERREALRHLVVEPEIPLDEMTMPDYMKMRDKQR
jgi:hypothetical protein